MPTASLQTAAPTRIVALALLLPAAGFAAAPPAATGPPPPDACALLTPAEVAAEQQRPVVDTVPSAQPGTTIDLLQCVYRTEDLAGSVSLALTVPHAGTTGGARDFWRSRFHPGGGHRGKEDPPRPVAGLGEEAFWVGDPVAGSLYVLAGERFLRISVGGVRDQAERRERAARLAAAALGRLP